MVGSVLLATPGSVHSTFIELQLLIGICIGMGMGIGIGTSSSSFLHSASAYLALPVVPVRYINVGKKPTAKRHLSGTPDKSQLGVVPMQMTT